MVRNRLRTDVSVDVRTIADADGRLWVQLSFTSPKRPKAFSASYSPDTGRRLLELLEVALRSLDDNEAPAAIAPVRGPALSLVDGSVRSPVPASRRH
jgi:hypothetical protein